MEREEFKILSELFEAKKLRELKEEIITFNEADIAIFIEELEPLEAITVFRILPKDIAAETFSYFSSEMQNHIIDAMTNVELTEIVDKLYIDDIVDMLEELPAVVVSKIMKNISHTKREVVNQFLKYPKDSAGSIMTAEYIDVKMEATVGDAIERIRKKGISSESIYTVYIINANRTLEGFVSVRNLLINPDDKLIKDLIEEDVIFVYTTDDKEDVARKIKKYGFLALPVVDHEKRLVGLVTIDDAVDVLEEEATEDFERMAAMAPSDKPYLKTSVVTIAKNRFTWLLILMLSATFTGLIIDKYETILYAVAGLISFVPMLTDSGGNAGSQSSTMVIRSLALGEISTDDYKKVFLKELGVSVIVGFVLGLINFFRIYLLGIGSARVALTVSLTLMATIMMSKIIGGLLPMVAEKMKLDPTLMAAPLITTILDSLSLLVYCAFIIVFLI
ncbi:MAG: magnesium transporter [Tissierellia bacterium]|nr:magnesium transporter [Tissierellia bacterium]